MNWTNSLFIYKASCSSFLHTHTTCSLVFPETLHALWFLQRHYMRFGFSSDTTFHALWFLHTHYMFFGFSTYTTCSLVSPHTLHALWFHHRHYMLFGFSTDTTCSLVFPQTLHALWFLHRHYMLFGFSTYTTCSLVSPQTLYMCSLVFLTIAVEDERIVVLRELTPGLSGNHNNISVGGKHIYRLASGLCGNNRTF